MSKEKKIQEIARELDYLDIETVNVLHRIICNERGSIWKKNTGGKFRRPLRKLICRN